MNPDSCFRSYLNQRADGDDSGARYHAVQLFAHLMTGGEEPECWANRYFGDRRRLRFFHFCAENGISEDSTLSCSV